MIWKYKDAAAVLPKYFTYYIMLPDIVVLSTAASVLQRWGK